MKSLSLFLLLFISIQQTIDAQTDFVLDPSQSMLMTGKGAGQDGTINPYKGEDCLAIIENTGNADFSIRIQKKGKIINEIAISKGETKRFKLLKDQELYLDPNPKNIAKARVSYEKIE